MAFKTAFKIEHRIGIQAPVETVWEVLSDLTQWGSWSRLYPEAAGRLLIGERLALTEQVPGQPPRRISPTVVDWVPNAQIIWHDKIMNGSVRVTRYVEIERLTDTGCIFSNGQFFDGFVAKFLSRAQRRAIREGFTAFGEAMKAQAEAQGPRA